MKKKIKKFLHFFFVCRLYKLYFKNIIDYYILLIIVTKLTIYFARTQTLCKKKLLTVIKNYILDFRVFNN